MSAELNRVRETILDWYALGRRDLPWRRTTDPYAVLVSEVMLQQTQATRVAERFPRFMARFSTLRALADADSGDLLAEWAGLGYNRRALSLRATAVSVIRDGWPSDVADLERLPGVGPYTARALASLAFGQRVGVVDTNVRRWLVRRFGVLAPRDLQRLADALASAGSGAAADWTHASMEFGARICRSARPACDQCPLAADCPARGRAGRASVRRQPPYRGSRRAYRGTLLRLLAAAKNRALTVGAARRGLAAASPRIGAELDDAGWSRLVEALKNDGLVTARGPRLLLGGPRVESLARREG